MPITVPKYLVFVAKSFKTSATCSLILFRYALVICYSSSTQNAATFRPVRLVVRVAVHMGPSLGRIEDYRMFVRIAPGGFSGFPFPPRTLAEPLIQVV